MARDTRDRIIVTTAKLMARQGYHGTGLNQVVAEAAAPKGSMYFHFPLGKEQLAAEAVRASAAYVDRALVAHESSTALASLDGYLVDVIARLADSGYREGCPIATVGLEVGATLPVVGEACAEAYEGLRDRVAGWIERDGATREVAERRALIIYAALEGALLFAKASGSVEPLEALRRSLPALLELPVEGARPRHRRRRAASSRSPVSSTA